MPPINPSGTSAAELVRRVRLLELRTRRLMTTHFLGGYQSVFRGRGIEFSEVREYGPGDDARIIDWNVTARMGRPYVKKFQEERELNVLLAVDVSGSSRFGSQAQSKVELATEVAALLALAAVRNNDRAGLITFTDRVEHFVPPGKGSQHALRIIRDLLAAEPAGRGTDLTAPLRYVSRVARRRSVVFILSDFLAAGYEAPLRTLARRHDVIAVRLTDPREAELPPVGPVELVDAETGDRVLVDAADPAVRQRFAQLQGERTRDQQRLLRSVGVDQVDLSTALPYGDALMAFFRRRARRV
ncbi:MAG TPA: DUF58 domain-containing protein [Dehalococcoidia bacterium]